MTGHSAEREPVGHAQAQTRVTSRLRLMAVGVLVVVGVGLAAWAGLRMFRIAATEVSNQSSASPQHAGPEQGAAAPPFEVPGYDGRPLRLEAFRGHPIVLNFWTSWCPPCEAEADTLEHTYRTYRDRGVVFIGIDLQNDTWEASRAFLIRHKITYPVGRDERGKVGRVYRVVGIPTTYFIGPDGTIHGPALTGGFTGKDGARDLVLQIEKLLR